jgi:glycosyltransferase involved in cell wall biosynthesis
MAKVLHVTTIDLSLVMVLGPQLRAFRAAGYDVYGASAPGPWVDEIRSWGVEFVPIPHAVRSMSPGRDAVAMAEMWSAMRKLRPDIVHTHFIKPSTFARPAARAARVPVVVDTVHGLYATPESSLVRRSVVYGLEYLMSRCADLELVQNPEDVPVMRRLGIPEEKIELIGNGVDLARFDPSKIPADIRTRLRQEFGAKPDDVVAGVVARLTWEKGFRELFAAARILRRLAPRVLLVVVGLLEPDKSDGVSEEDLAEAQRTSRVHYAGFRTDVEQIYTAFDLFVLPSHREGFLRSGMEAAAMGLPIVTTDVRGCRQVVDHGVTGSLVPLRDPERLAMAVADLANDRSRLEAMGRAGRKKALSEFDQQRVIDLTLAAYGRLLASGGARRTRRAPAA